jgi:hypothetical protein
VVARKTPLNPTEAEFTLEKSLCTLSIIALDLATKRDYANGPVLNHSAFMPFGVMWHRSLPTPINYRASEFNEFCGTNQFQRPNGISRT